MLEQLFVGVEKDGGVRRHRGNTFGDMLSEMELRAAQKNVGFESAGDVTQFALVEVVIKALAVIEDLAPIRKNNVIAGERCIGRALYQRIPGPLDSFVNLGTESLLSKIAFS